ncbi:transglutaminase TgpA family protein [Luteimonas sp. e5]
MSARPRADAGRGCAAMMLDDALRRSLWPMLALCLAPLLRQLPGNVALAVLATAALVALGSWRRPLPPALRLLLALIAIGAVLASFGLRLGRDTGCALLAAMLAIKPAETRSLRDARSLTGFALFAPFAAFLLDQGPLSLLLGLLASIGALLTLLRLSTAEAGIALPPLPRAAGQVGRLLALGLPLALAAFWLFPRIGSPLWGVPDRAQAKIGLSDHMAPGDWLDLLVDDSPALRARFLGPAPALQAMYWRGPVLWDFDGRTWRAGAAPMRSQPAARTPAGAGWRYELEVEPSERRYITALDLPQNAPEGSVLAAEGNLFAHTRLQTVTRWQLHSAPPRVFAAELTPAQRARALAFPRQFNPRAQQLARRWQEESGGDAAAIVEHAMAMVNAELAYSLAPPALGRDSVDEFLFQTRTGYCEHFSSAFVFLMRAAGVPARVVTGYAGGYRNALGDYWVVRNSDAHAWAEVWLAGRGWVRVDPTAAVAPERIFDTVGDRRPGRIGDFDGFTRFWDVADWMRRGWNDFVLGFNAERQSRMLQWLGVERLQPRHLVLLLSLGSLLALGWMLWWLRRGERERDPLLRAWHRLGRRYQRLGLARDANETAGDWAARVAKARPRDAAQLQALAARFVAARYAPAGADEALLRDLQRHRPARD